MPQITLQAGMKMFVPDHDDIKRATHEALTEDREFALARGNKHMDLPQTLKGTPVSSAILLGGGIRADPRSRIGVCVAAAPPDRVRADRRGDPRHREPVQE